MSDLIPFRALMKPYEPTKRFTVNGLIHFPNGDKGIIRSITDVECMSNGDVYVIGKYRPFKEVYYE